MGEYVNPVGVDGFGERSLSKKELGRMDAVYDGISAFGCSIVISLVGC